MIKKDPVYINWHTHTPLCKHARGCGADFACQVPESIGKIGFADHAPFPDGRYSSSAMAYTQLDEYLGYISAAAEKVPGIECVPGLEAEWCPDLGKDFYYEHYFSRGIKYLIGSAHYSAEGGKHFMSYDFRDTAVIKGFVRQTIDMIESGIFMYICHPDAYLRPMEKLDPSLKSGFIDILEAAKEYDAALEYNCNGLRYKVLYPCREFWELAAEYKVRTVLGSDAHCPEKMYDEAWYQGMSHFSELGIVPCNNQLVPGVPCK